jgi:hypothetical protein
MPSTGPGSGAMTRPGSTPRWPVRLAYHLADRAEADGVTLGGGVFWPNAADGLEPAAALAYERLAADGRAHHMIGHVRSSQAFALNLFAPLGEEGRRAIAASLGVESTEVSEPQFEWSDPEDQLCERTHASPHATQVDVRLDCVTRSGASVTCLIEVKLSEPGFNFCSAWLSPRNDRLDVCATPGPLRQRSRFMFPAALRSEPIRPAPPPRTLRGQHVVFTGKLTTNRPAAQAAAKAAGATVQGRVNGAASLIVAGQPNPLQIGQQHGTKLYDAHRRMRRGHPISIINEEHFRHLVR